MLGQHRLVQLDPPPRAGRDAQLAGRDLGQRRDELVAPGHVVDVVLEDPRVRDRRAPLGGDEGRKVRVVVVRRAVDLERLGEVGDLLRLVEAVPDHVDRRDVHPARFEIRAEATARVEVLARADRHGRDVADVGERGRIEEVDLEPEQIERLQRLRDPHAAFRLEVEVEVDDRARVAPSPLGKRLEQPHERVGDLLARAACRRPR